MKHGRLRRRSLLGEPASLHPSIQIDEDVWLVVVAMTDAASRGDRESFLRINQQFLDALGVKGGRTAGLYLVFMLRYRMIELLGHRPSADELHVLTVRFYPSYAVLIRRGGSRGLERVFLTVFAMLGADDQIDRHDFWSMSVVALGVLLRDPAADLEPMRAGLLRWLNGDAAKTSALIDDADA
jgi:hypothetical protein